MKINEICNLLKNELLNNNYKYGFYSNRKLYKPNFLLGFDKEFEYLLHTIYIVQAPEDTMREKVGTCMDEVVLMAYILDNHNVSHKTWLLYNLSKNRVHTILTFEAEGKIVYLELTPEYKKPWYGKEILYDSEQDFLEFCTSQGYEVLNITDKIQAGTQPLSFLPYKYKLIRHYDMLIDENNDPIHDQKSLKDYMDKWDGLTFIDQLGLNGKKTVLEIGVGTGRLAIRVADMCKTFSGIDISSKTIGRAKDNLSAYLNINLICGDFLTYEFDTTFDVIYSSLTFMHIKDKEAALRKIADLLSNDGRFVLSIDKNPSTVIDTGTNKIAIYPDSPEEIAKSIQSAKLILKSELETEFAYIFVAEK